MEEIDLLLARAQKVMTIDKANELPIRFGPIFNQHREPIKDDSPYSVSAAWLREKAKPPSGSTGIGVALISRGRTWRRPRPRDPSSREDAHEGGSGCGRDGYACERGIVTDARRSQE
jgi:hypothetical protein